LAVILKEKSLEDWERLKGYLMRLVAIFALFTISLIGDNRLQMAIDSAESGSLLETFSWWL